MTSIRDLHGKWMEDPAYREEYETLEGEFTLASTLIRAHLSSNEIMNECEPK